jgi:hypothetical protein
LDESYRQFAIEHKLENEPPVTENLSPAFQHWYECQGDSVEVVYNGRYFFAWENGRPSWNG